eukprot:12683316-Ditylum_brightwellii.AAC.1
MLNEHIYPVMKTYWLRGGAIGHNVDVINIAQDIGGWVQRLQSPTPSNTTLPGDNSVKGQVNVVEEEELGQETQNILTAARDTNTSPIQATPEPDQGGPSGVNDPDKD